MSRIGARLLVALGDSRSFWGRCNLLGAVALIGTLGLAPATTDAASSWSIVQAAVPLSPQGSLVAVSCLVTGDCQAVGSAVRTSGQGVTLAEAWNGTHWAIERTPDPIGSEGSELLGVSCVSASACTAVGYTAGSSGRDATLVESWNGARWTIERTPELAGSTGSQLLGISCAASTACFAVGYSSDRSTNSKALAEAWDGKNWSVTKTPDPTLAQWVQLSGVSCSAAATCTAVGYSTDSGGTEVTLAEAWNGAAWSIEKTPNPSGSSGSQLSGVSCTSEASCQAVGENYGSSAPMTLAEAWNGSAWSIEKSPSTKPTWGIQLSSIACTSATACTAVGNAFSPSRQGGYSTLAEVWNGAKWAIQTTPSPAGLTFSNLSGASCASPTVCVTVGNFTGVAANPPSMLTETKNGTSWVIEKTPSPDGAAESDLSSLSCASARACMAIGSYWTGRSGTSGILAESWNGRNWTIEPVPAPTGSKGTELVGVSCTSTDACTAVGWYYTTSSGGQTMIAERWNGTRWSIENTPEPPGEKESALFDVSCTSASACTAVGWVSDSADTLDTLAESWNGEKWAIEKTLDPSKTKRDAFYAVSCSSASDCTAVGEYPGSTGATETLAEHSNGAIWAVEKTPNPPNATSFSVLSGVSCATSTSCTAVGDYAARSATVVLAEGWNGSAWAIDKVLNPTGGHRISRLSEVSCTTARTCTAVGLDTDSSGDGITLAASWNGTEWTVEPTPDPAGSNGSGLSGVSCATSAACIAVGFTQYGNGGTSVPLVEARH